MLLLFWFIINDCHVLNGKKEAILLWVLNFTGEGTPGQCFLLDQTQGISSTPVFSTGPCGPMNEGANALLTRGPVLIPIESSGSLAIHFNELDQIRV